MIDSIPRRKGDETRMNCLQGARGLLAALQRRINKLRDDEESCTVIVEINAANGVLSAVKGESTRVEPLPGGSDPDDLLPRILDRIDELALPERHGAIKIEIVSVKGALSAVSTETVRHRWDVTN